jgi:hypothetical protein
MLVNTAMVISSEWVYNNLLSGEKVVGLIIYSV